MAEEVGSAAGKTVTMAALKSFMNPSLDIIKTIPQGIIELALRGSAAVRSYVCFVVLKNACSVDFLPRIGQLSALCNSCE